MTTITALILAGCWISPSDWDEWDIKHGEFDTAEVEGDADTDADGDTDTDSDADGDSDADADADSDTDTDSDSDTDTDVEDLDGDGWTVDEGDCDDGDRTVHPGGSETCLDGVDQDCDGVDPYCAMTGLEEAHARYLATQDDEWLGYELTGAGDLDGDGYDDVVVSAGGHMHLGDNTGAVHIWYGPHAGDLRSDAADVTWTGQNGGTYRVAVAGDVNDDGLADFVVVEPGDLVASGVAYVVLGPATAGGSLADADWVITGDSSLGAWTGTAGDIDGDGDDEVLVTSNDSLQRGVTYLFDSPMAGSMTTSDAVAVIVGDAQNLHAQYSTGGTDFTGDGVVDVAVGAFGDETNGDDAGAVFVMAGPSVGSLSTSDADATLYGEVAGDWAGMPVASAGDHDGDGYEDLLVGACLAGELGVNPGKAYLVRGPLSGTLQLAASEATLLGEYDGDRAGYRVMAVEDVNGDSRPELAISSPYRGAGQVYLLLDTLSGSVPLSGADFTFQGESGTTVTGNGLGQPGDIDGDGLDDLLIGASYAASPYASGLAGMAYLLLGSHL